MRRKTNNFVRSAIWIILALTVIQVVSVELLAQSKISIKSRRVENELLVDILNRSELEDLTKLSSYDKKWPSRTQQFLSVRLYSIAVEGSCVPGTHYVCGYRYYLAVREFDILPDMAVYDLGEIGDITGIEWLEPTQIDRAGLKIVLHNYPTYIAAQFPKLELSHEKKTVYIDVSVDSLTIREIPKF